MRGRGEGGRAAVNGERMRELTLKYGCNPDQGEARADAPNGLPFIVRNGSPGYINLLDALNAWQLVRELRAACGLPAAASFKHVSPAGAALGLPLDETDRLALRAGDVPDPSPIACAYIRARGADRLSSFGDFAALSDVCDESAAAFLRREVSDGIIAPGYTEGALAILRQKRGGRYLVLEIDPAYEPPALERREVFGVTFTQARSTVRIGAPLLQNVVTARRSLPGAAVRDLLVALVTLRYTQSNSVCLAWHGQAVGVGAGQQSRLHCTRLAADKADLWRLRRHEKALALPFLPQVGRPARDNATAQYLGGDADALLADGAWQALFSHRPEPLTAAERADWLAAAADVSLGSDAFFPFADSIERAAQSGVAFIAQPGGSVRDAEVIAACDRHGMAMAFTGVRLFHH